MSKEILKIPPAQLFDAAGHPNYGNFAGPIGDLNYRQFDFKALERWPWTMTDSLAIKLLKHWEFVGVIDEDLVLGGAVVHLNYVGTGFAYVYDRKSGEIVEKNLKMPLARGTTFSPSAVDGASEIRHGDQFIRLDNTCRDGRRHIELRCGELAAEIYYREVGTGVTTVTHQSLVGFGHTYKFIGLPAEGRVVVRGRETQLSPKAKAILDWSCATPPRQTVWNWAAATGTDQKGRSVGINFSTGLIAAGFTENTVWLNGKPQMINAIHFAYDRNDIVGKPWRVGTAAGDVDLTFQPERERHEFVNFGVVKSKFHQPFGRFSGTIDLGREKAEVDLYGFCEEHFAKW